MKAIIKEIREVVDVVALFPECRECHLYKDATTGRYYFDYELEVVEYYGN